MKININSITEFLGWCTLINFGLLTLSTISIVLFRKFIIRTHSTLFGIKEKKGLKLQKKLKAKFVNGELDFGKINVLVNSAGISLGSDVVSTDFEVWKKVKNAFFMI